MSDNADVPWCCEDAYCDDDSDLEWVCEACGNPVGVGEGLCEACMADDEDDSDIDDYDPEAVCEVCGREVGVWQDFCDRCYELVAADAMEGPPVPECKGCGGKATINRDECGTCYSRRMCEAEEGVDRPAHEPSHYRSKSGRQVFDWLEDFGLDGDHYLAAAVEYVVRAGKKTADMRDDLRKAVVFIERRIKTLEG